MEEKNYLTFGEYYGRDKVKKLLRRRERKEQWKDFFSKLKKEAKDFITLLGLTAIISSPIAWKEYKNGRNYRVIKECLSNANTDVYVLNEANPIIWNICSDMLSKLPKEFRANYDISACRDEFFKRNSLDELSARKLEKDTKLYGPSTNYVVNCVKHR